MHPDVYFLSKNHPICKNRDEVSNSRRLKQTFEDIIKDRHPKPITKLFSTLTAALQWAVGHVTDLPESIRAPVQEVADGHMTTRGHVQVLVTGSFPVVGNMLRLFDPAFSQV